MTAITHLKPVILGGGERRGGKREFEISRSENALFAKGKLCKNTGRQEQFAAGKSVPEETAILETRYP